MAPLLRQTPAPPSMYAFRLLYHLKADPIHPNGPLLHVRVLYLESVEMASNQRTQVNSPKGIQNPVFSQAMIHGGLVCPPSASVSPLRYLALLHSVS